MAPNQKNQIQAYKPGKRAGLDVASRRYRDIDGRIISKAEFEHGLGRGFYGGKVKMGHTSPNSAIMGKLERLVSRAERGEDLTKDPLVNQIGERFNRVLAATKPYPKEQTRPIPPEIRAAMRLADYYFRAAGDVEAHARTPMEVATGGELEIQCPDPIVKKRLTDLYNQLDMWTVLSRLWMSAAQYGIGLPYEIWDTTVENGDLVQIVDLPPYYVWIGFALPFGASYPNLQGDPGSAKFDKGANYALLPFNDGDRWTKDAFLSQIMPMTFNSIGYNQNENLARGWNVPLSNDCLQPVRAFSYGYERYPVIPTSRAFQSLGTRTIFDEVVRGTIEGYQNQLWVFTLGTEKSMPRGDELLALQAELAGMAGERTGRLLWRYGLKVDLYAPKTLDQMLSAETRQAFTLESFRQLGGNIRIETGNPLIGQRETAADKVDLSVWLRRLEWPRRVVLAWEKYLRAKIMKRWGPAAEKVNETTQVLWSRSLLEVSQVIEQELMPMYRMGWLSKRTGLKKAGESYAQELANKIDEQADEEYFMAPATFSQTTVKPDTEPSQTDSQPSRGVRAQIINLSAAWEQDASRSLLLQSVSANVQKNLIETPDVEAFIGCLTASTTEHLGHVTWDAYRATGGAQADLPADTVLFSANFVNAFADGFRSRLLSDQEQGSDLSVHAGRAMLYATEGYKMAVVNGQRLAMKDKGVRAWRRVVGVDACPACRADATVMHGINEPFTLVHVSESLAREELSVQYYSAAGLPGVHVPVPSYTNETTELLKQLGSRKHTQRRARD